MAWLGLGYDTEIAEYFAIFGQISKIRAIIFAMFIVVLYSGGREFHLKYLTKARTSLFPMIPFPIQDAT